jgi:methoxymalonate biosynthesis protein
VGAAAVTAAPAGELAVVGAGVMGIGLATLAVGRGLPVTLVDVDPGQRAEAEGRVYAQLRTAQLLGALPRDRVAGQLRVTADIEAVAEATAVVEAVAERPAIKAEVLAAASAAVLPGTLVATNTSAIPVAELAAATKRPDWFVGTHFMNPPYLIRLVEIVRAPATSEAAMAALHGLLSALDRDAVLVADGPGFVSNRVLMKMINQAAHLAADGRTGVAELDLVFTGCLGHRTGPLATADIIGLDNVVDTLTVLYERTGDEGYRPAEPLLTAVRDGRLGRKTGHGFHRYEAVSR